MLEPSRARKNTVHFFSYLPELKKDRPRTFLVPSRAKKNTVHIPSTYRPYLTFPSQTSKLGSSASPISSLLTEPSLIAVTLIPGTDICLLHVHAFSAHYSSYSSPPPQRGNDFLRRFLPLCARGRGGILPLWSENFGKIKGNTPSWPFLAQKMGSPLIRGRGVNSTLLANPKENVDYKHIFRVPKQQIRPSWNSMGSRRLFFSRSLANLLLVVSFQPPHTHSEL